MFGWSARVVAFIWVFVWELSWWPYCRYAWQRGPSRLKLFSSGTAYSYPGLRGSRGEGGSMVVMLSHGLEGVTTLIMATFLKNPAPYTEPKNPT